jgi:hypothetical protein
MSEKRPDLTRTTLGVLLIAGLIAAAFWILRPFLPMYFPRGIVGQSAAIDLTVPANQ